MAQSRFDLLTLLQLITAVSAKIPQAWKLLMALYELFAPEIEAAVPDSGLEMVALSPEEEAYAAQITQALSAEGSQAAIDFTRLRKLVKFFNQAQNSDIGKFLIGVLTRLASGS